MNALRKCLGIALVAFAAGGCSAKFAGHSGAHVHTGSPVHTDHAGLHLSFAIGDTASNVIVAGAMLAVLAADGGYAATPPMKADRTINEQDCRKPIERPAANLRCR